MYDTVSNLSWSVDLRTHPVANMIDTILAEPWPPAEELGREVPEAVPQGDDCIVRLPFGDIHLVFLFRLLFAILMYLRSTITDPLYTGMLQLGVWGFRLILSENVEVLSALRL